MLKKNNKGQTFVETALILPIILLVVMGIIEFGRIFSGYLILTNASREGARYGVIHYSSDADIISTTKDNCYTFDPADLTVTVSPALADRKKGEELTVRVQTSIPIIAPFIGPIIGNPFEIDVQTVMRIE
jgi:Flp pilus assembly protein TadG